MKFSSCCVFALTGLPFFEAFIPQNGNISSRIQLRRSHLNAKAPSLFDYLNELKATDDIKQNISPIFDSIKEKVSPSLSPEFLQPLITISKDLSELLSTASLPVVEKINEFAAVLDASTKEYLSLHPTLKPLYDEVILQISKLPSIPQESALLIGSVVNLIALASIFSSVGTEILENPYPSKKYDAGAAREYYRSRFPLVLSRALQIGTSSLGFGLSLLKDYTNGNLEKNSDKRGIELSELLTTLGPSFIKIGQSLSIRTDLLSPAYVRGLKTLQDQVPPFDSTKAKKILAEGWGSSVDSILSKISEEPVAAASLGQVYKATLKTTGEEVAIKVLRPNIEGQIALDMHILREIAPVVKKLFNVNTDLVGIVDYWGAGFVDELDYISEAQNSRDFMDAIQRTPLKDVVFAPPVIANLSTEKVLTTEWVIGERLDRSAKEDVTVLCSIAMNSYLTMMLELGALHSDPHPGNLLRTQDGKLCILDWGMVTRLDSDLQLTLISHMAHLVSRDYEEIPSDLLKLGFIPKDKEHLIADSGIVEVLGDIYGRWTEGGGAASVNVNQVIAQLQDLQAQKGNLFQIPPYFAYIAKCFSVLEGIGLSNDAKYSIINECLPYVSKRLLTDQNKKTGAALNTFIFGPDKLDIDTRLVDYKRVEQLVEGFSDYSTSASGALLGKENLSRTEMLDDAAEQVLDLVFCEEETPLQTIVLEQLAKIIGARARSAWADLKKASGSLPSGRSRLGTIVDPLGFWRTSPLVTMNEMDTLTIETTQKLVTLMQSQVQQSNNPMFDLSTVSREETAELASILGQKVWERRSGVLKTGNRLVTQILKITAKKLEIGERDSILLPPIPEPVMAEILSRSNNIEENTTQQSSNRLQNARKKLSELETADSV